MSTLFDPIAQARAAGSSAIDEPIVNPPYAEPGKHWQVFDPATMERHEPRLIDGRRSAGYFYAPKGSKYEGSKLDEEFVPLDTVNEIRRRVGQWREDGYRGVTQVTRRLLEHWNSPEREPRLFFCQLEAIETLIWLHEASPAARQGLTADLRVFLGSEDVARAPLEDAHEPFRRYCAKMATGTGKTVVMAMLIAWSALNKLTDPRDTRFSDAVLLVAPGVTVKERLRVLIPAEPGNYYEKFDLVPPHLRDLLNGAKVALVHRQELAVKDDAKSKSVQKLGRESDSAFANRLLKRALGSKNRLLVLNDEGHHCYRPRDKDDDEATKEEKEENQHAAQWITGLEKIHAARGILTCVDLSATPFFIHGSGYPVGRPFPWIVSDFGLVDAIESGLVKIPQIPVDDTSGHKPPAYFHLWKWINDRLPAADRESAKRKAKPEAVVREAEPAVVTMIGNWLQEFKAWQEAGAKASPAMIVVTQDTKLSELLYHRLTREDFEFKEFVNRPGQQVTYLYDSKQFDKAEEGETVKEAEQRLRKVMNTVGKEGEPGADVRCIVSVSMLTEGWDANNVTQIVGLRAFTSQLLCEQVVGRALRRRSYDVDPETGLLRPEYADVYGVPFQVIPVKAKRAAGVGGALAPSTLIRALDERKHFELTFPRVEGYLAGIEDRVVCDWENVLGVKISSKDEPTEVYVKGVAGFRIGRPDIGGPGALERHDRIPYYQLGRVQSALFKIAASLVELAVPGASEAEVVRRARLFPQYLEIVKRYVSEYVVFDEAPEGELLLEKWQDKIVNVLGQFISGDDAHGEPNVLPRIERHRKDGSTSEVQFRTGREVRETIKSHISHVVLDAPTWESSVTTRLERCSVVESYARNDHMDFVIPYMDAQGEAHHHRPDFIVRLSNGLLVALEIKGYARELDEIKIQAGKKWAAAVNRYYGVRRWAYHVCYQPTDLEEELQGLST